MTSFQFLMWCIHETKPLLICFAHNSTAFSFLRSETVFKLIKDDRCFWKLGINNLFLFFSLRDKKISLMWKKSTSLLWSCDRLSGKFHHPDKSFPRSLSLKFANSYRKSHSPSVTFLKLESTRRNLHCQLKLVKMGQIFIINSTSVCVEKALEYFPDGRMQMKTINVLTHRWIAQIKTVLWNLWLRPNWPSSNNHARFGTFESKFCSIS